MAVFKTIICSSKIISELWIFLHSGFLYYIIQFCIFTFLLEMTLPSWDWSMVCMTMAMLLLLAFPILVRRCLMTLPVTLLAGEWWTVSRLTLAVYSIFSMSAHAMLTFKHSMFVFTVYGNTPAILQEAAISVVEHAVCSTPQWWGSIALETMVCAGGDGIISGCQVQYTRQKYAFS